MFFKVGDVAKQIGTTVRSLHHYDEIGLLIPKHRSEAGYRLYMEEDLMQLQKIKSLQQLGFSLEEIQKLFSDSNLSLHSVLEKQINSLRDKVKRELGLIDRLQKLVNVLAQCKKPSIEVLLDALKETVMYEKYFTENQLKQLETRRNAMGEDTLKSGQQEWQDIFSEISKLKEAGKPISSPEVQKLAKRSLELIEEFTGGDRGIRQSLQKMYDTEGDKILRQDPMNVDKDLYDFFQQALDYSRKS